MLYPVEDKRQKQLMYFCKVCKLTTPASDGLIYRNDIIPAHTDKSAVLADLATDPTLPRTSGVTCPKCHAHVAVCFQGQILGYKRGKHLQQENTTIVRISHVDSREDASWYLGKRVAFVYHGKKARIVNGKPSHTRIIWGKVVRVHGNSGAVKAKFRVNLPPSSFGSSVRVMMYPSQI